MSPVTITIDGLDQLKRSSNGSMAAFNRALKQVVKDSANELRKQERARVKSKRAKRRIQVKLTTDGGHPAAVITPGFPGQFEEAGARPHQIRPKKAARLAFDVGGVSRSRKARGKGKGRSEAVVVSSVNHPGRAARPFVQGSLRATEPMVKQRVQEETQKMVDGIHGARGRS